jgi:hypothetical protein
MAVDRDYYHCNVDAKPPTTSEAPGTAAPFDRARTPRAVKMLVVVAAVATTLLWVAFLCYVLANMAGSLLFN